ncbi:MAG: NADH-quinone oxidoreductase subunit C [Rickettsia sp.]|nr:NADH-quinone oxidoreductase subunit C [Rickettsia sp.]
MMEKIFTEFSKQNKIDFYPLSVRNFSAYRVFEFSHIVKIISFLKFHPYVRMTILIDLFCADFPNLEKRFEISYSFLSLKLNKRFLLKINISENDSIGSIANIFVNSTWYEREIFDMFGVIFNCKMNRILTDYGFKGHPLRKDFPLSGNLEIRYDNNMKKIIHEPVVLDQEFRNFDFESEWKGPNY